jgi:hypothetical protein
MTLVTLARIFHSDEEWSGWEAAIDGTPELSRREVGASISALAVGDVSSLRIATARRRLARYDKNKIADSRGYSGVSGRKTPRRHCPAAASDLTTFL